MAINVGIYGARYCTLDQAIEATRGFGLINYRLEGGRFLAFDTEGGVDVIVGVQDCRSATDRLLGGAAAPSAVPPPEADPGRRERDRAGLIGLMGLDLPKLPPLSIKWILFALAAAALAYAATRRKGRGA